FHDFGEINEIAGDLLKKGHLELDKKISTGIKAFVAVEGRRRLLQVFPTRINYNGHCFWNSSRRVSGFDQREFLTGGCGREKKIKFFIEGTFGLGF
ncbi:Hypothetical predicted protein, partial [Olea europaea subsp. europaea]